MYSEEVYDELRDWAGKTLALAREQLPLMGPVAQNPAFTAEQRKTLGPLLSASARSGEVPLYATSMPF